MADSHWLRVEGPDGRAFADPSTLNPQPSTLRVVLPAHLRTLARVESEVEIQVEGPATLRSILDALEASYPMLRGTIRDHVTQQRRPFLRFFACAEDLSHERPDAPLPDAVARGEEPFLIVGAIAGG
jgi:molybdopterin synthase sulfur carrier subunit